MTNRLFWYEVSISGMLGVASSWTLVLTTVSYIVISRNFDASVQRQRHHDRQASVLVRCMDTAARCRLSATAANAKPRRIVTTMSSCDNDLVPSPLVEIRAKRGDARWRPKGK